MFAFAPSPRVRPSPFYEAIVADGVKGFTVYNHMCLPVGFGDPAAEYDRLMNGVSLWDVAAERQVEIQGPDAARIVQTLSARDMSKCAIGQGKYTPMCNRDGILVNDPIVLKLADDHFWVSIADSDVKLMAEGIAYGQNLNVKVCEPDVSPLALQGPKAVEVVAHVVGDWVRDLKYFWFRETEIDGIPVVVQRSGWSKQGGFEVYLRDGSKGTQLYNIFNEAGKAWGIGPGNPNNMERIESGLVSVGTDTDDTTNPFEVRLEKFVNLDIDADVIGLDALRRIHAEGPKRHTLGVVFDDNKESEFANASFYADVRWQSASRNGKPVGHVTATTPSIRMGKIIGFALVNRADANIGDSIEVTNGRGEVSQATLVDIPFV